MRIIDGTPAEFRDAGFLTSKNYVDRRYKAGHDPEIGVELGRKEEPPAEETVTPPKAEEAKNARKTKEDKKAEKTKKDRKAEKPPKAEEAKNAEKVKKTEKPPKAEEVKNVAEAAEVAEAKRKEADLERLAKKQTRQDKNLKGIQKKIARYQKELDELKKNCSENKERIAFLEKKLGGLHKAQGNLEKAMVKTNAEVAGIKTELDALKQTVEGVTKQVGENTHEIQRFGQELGKQHQEQKELAKKVETLGKKWAKGGKWKKILGIVAIGIAAALGGGVAYSHANMGKTNNNNADSAQDTTPVTPAPEDTTPVTPVPVQPDPVTPVQPQNPEDEVGKVFEGLNDGDIKVVAEVNEDGSIADYPGKIVSSKDKISKVDKVNHTITVHSDSLDRDIVYTFDRMEEGKAIFVSPNKQEYVLENGRLAQYKHHKGFGEADQHRKIDIAA